VVFSGYSGFLHQYNCPPRYNWNIVESGFKHQKPKLFIIVGQEKFEDTKRLTRHRNSEKDRQYNGQKKKKDRQYNGQKKKKDKKTNNGRQSITQKTNDWVTELD